MTKGYNKAILIGRVGRIGMTRYFDTGGACVEVSLATSEVWRAAGGAPSERTEWHTLQFSGKDAEVIGQHLEQGQWLQVEGKMRVRSYKKGDETHYFHYVDVEAFEFGAKARTRADGATAPGPAAMPAPQQGVASPPPKAAASSLQASGQEELAEPSVAGKAGRLPRFMRKSR